MQKLAESAVIAREGNGEIKARVSTLTHGAKSRFDGSEFQGLTTDHARDLVSGCERVRARVTNRNPAETNKSLGANTAVGRNQNCCSRIDGDAQRMTRRLKPHAGWQS